MQSGNDRTKVLSSMKDIINSCGSLMEVTGGALRADKSWYYLVDYVWKRFNWLATDSDVELDLIVTDMTGERMVLSHFKCDEAAEMLGV